MKKCAKCKEEKPTSAFGPNKKSTDRLNYYCRKCMNVYIADWGRRNRPKRNDVKRRWLSVNTEDKRKRAKDLRLQRMYGLTLVEFDKKFDSQSGGCAICGEVSRLDVDHCHTTGAVRGLLCRACNMALGAFRDDSGLLESALAYLRVYQKGGESSRK